jgi:phospholipase/carboxylesterase
MNHLPALLPAIEIEPSNQLSKSQTATASIIWLHGLGATGDDFASLVPELKGMLGEVCNSIRFIFPHAPEIPVTINGGMVMPAWYDILGMPTQAQAEREINQNQLLSSVKGIQALIDREIERGVKSERILVLGFSQGGAVAYHAVLSYPQPLAGLGGLSTYFPTLDTNNRLPTSPANQGIDIQIYHGTFDPIVQLSLGQKAQQDLTRLGYQTQWHDYPMEHQLCYEQVQDIATWINSQLG